MRCTLWSVPYIRTPDPDEPPPWWCEPVILWVLLFLAGLLAVDLVHAAAVGPETSYPHGVNVDGVDP